MAPAVARVRERVVTWRRTRTRRSPMPEELWAAAISLAEAHGVYRVSQDLGVNYDSLKARLARSSRGPSRDERRGVADVTQPTFLEVKAVPVSAVAAGGYVADVAVEVGDGGGAKLTIRLGADAAVDVCGVVAAFVGGVVRK